MWTRINGTKKCHLAIGELYFYITVLYERRDFREIMYVKNPFLCAQVVWRYLLNVYPDGLTGQERMDYMKSKTREYDQLKGEWSARASPEDLEFIRGNVLKDVLRTDRAHPYYAGSEDSPHLTALTDLLTTFAITHPQVLESIFFSVLFGSLMVALYGHVCIPFTFLDMQTC